MKDAGLLRFCFVILSLLMAVAAITLRPAAANTLASSPLWVDDTGQDVLLQQDAWLPLSDVQDGEVVQPPWYEPHEPPAEPEEPGELEEPASEYIPPLMAEPPLSPDSEEWNPPDILEQDSGELKEDESGSTGASEAAEYSAEDGIWIGEWFVPGEALAPHGEELPDRDEQDEADAPISLGYSSDSENLFAIRSATAGIFYLLTFCVAGVIVFLICRAVWPLFRY